MSSNNFQDNRGKRWSPEEDFYLMQQIQFLSYFDIGKHLKRSENAVVSRIKKLAFHMIQNGEDACVVQKNLRLSSEDMDQINNECFLYSRKTAPPGKFISTVKKPIKKGYFVNQQQSQELQLLIEIRSMLRRLLYPNEKSELKSPRREREGIEIKVSEINLEDLEKRSEEFAKLN
jgi:hypothetical protein